MTILNKPDQPSIVQRRGWRTQLGRLHHPAVMATWTALTMTAVVILLRTYGWFQPLELTAYDMLRVAWAGHALSSRVVLVGATEQDITAKNVSGNRVWGWPLSDAALAELLQRLASWHPRAIGVDLYRDIPQPPGTVKLDAVVQQHSDIYWVFKMRDSATHLGVPPPKILRNKPQAVLADALGDADNVVRRGLLFAADGHKEYATLGMALAQAYLAYDHIRLVSDAQDDLIFGKALIKPLDRSTGPYMTPDGRGYQILLDYHGGMQPFREFTLNNIMHHPDLAALVRGQIVILGVAAESVSDGFSTPFNTGFGHAGRINGIALHAHLADQLIREALGQSPILENLPRRYEDLWILAWALAGAALGVTVRRTLFTLSGVLAGVAVIGGAVYLAFGRALLLPAVPAIAAWLGAGGLTNLLLYRASNRTNAVLRRAFEHYLPRPIIDQLVRVQEMPSREGELREITVLFSDVANFTTFSEGRDPTELAAITNAYLEGVSQAVLAHEGMVNTFMGDGVLALFDSQLAELDHADRAVDAALAIDRFSEEFRSKEPGFGHTRIGIHTGRAFIGNIGSSLRLQYTALGDILNTGSRLEQLNKVLGSRICASGDVVMHCRRHCFNPVGSFMLDGKTAPTQVFMPIGPRGDAI